MSGDLLSAWITRNLEEYARNYGQEMGRALPAKAHKVQIIRCITEETAQNPNQTIWLDVSDGLHEIPAKFTQEGKERFRRQMRNPLQRSVRFKNEALRGAIFLLEDIRLHLTKVPVGDGRTGLSHEEQLVLEVNKFSLIKTPEIVGDEIQIQQPPQGLKRCEWYGTNIHQWAVALRNGNDFKGDNWPSKAKARAVVEPKPKPAPLRKPNRRREETPKPLTTHHMLLWPGVCFPPRSEPPDVNGQTEFVESEEEPVSEEEEDMDLHTEVTVERNIPSSAYSWSPSTTPPERHHSPELPDNDLLGDDLASLSEGHTVPGTLSPLSHVSELTGSDNDEHEDMHESDEQVQPKDTDMDTSADDAVLLASASLVKQEEDTRALSILSLPPSSCSSVARELSDSEEEEEEVFHTAENTQTSQATNSTAPDLGLLISTSPRHPDNPHHSLLPEQVINNRLDALVNSQHQTRSISADSMKRNRSDSSFEDTNNEAHLKRMKKSPEYGRGAIDVRASDKGKSRNLDSSDSSDDDNTFDVLTSHDADWRPWKSFNSNTRPRTISGSASMYLSKSQLLPSTSFNSSSRSEVHTEGKSRAIFYSQSQQRPPLVDLTKWRAQNRKSTEKRSSQPPSAP